MITLFFTDKLQDRFNTDYNTVRNVTYEHEEKLKEKLRTCDLVMVSMTDRYGVNNSVKVRSKKGEKAQSPTFNFSDCLFIDFDKDLSIAEFESRFSPYEYILNTTRNHGKEKDGLKCDRFHVFFPLKARITDKSIFTKYLSLLVDLLGADPACKNYSRKFFGTGDNPNYYFKWNRGISIIEYLDHVTTPNGSGMDCNGRDLSIDQKVKSRDNTEIGPGERHGELLKMAVSLWNTDIPTQDELKEFLITIAKSRSAPLKEDFQKDIDGIVEYITTNNTIKNSERLRDLKRIVYREKDPEKVYNAIREYFETVGAERKNKGLQNAPGILEILQEHKERFSKKGLTLGLEGVPESDIYFNSGELVIVQSPSNHGKSSFMNHLNYSFLKQNDNTACIFMTYETIPLRVQEKFINHISFNESDCSIITKSNDPENQYLYGSTDTITKAYDKIKDRVFFPDAIYYEDLKSFIHSAKAKLEDKQIVLFLDYTQIIYNNMDLEGWERIKKISYGLEKLATTEDILIITGSQVNEAGDTREGKDIYNAACAVIDIFNHSHPKLERQEKLKKNRPFIGKERGKNVVSVGIDKTKFFDPVYYNEQFLFNGFTFDYRIVSGVKKDDDPMLENTDF